MWDYASGELASIKHDLVHRKLYYFLSLVPPMLVSIRVLQDYSMHLRMCPKTLCVSVKSAYAMCVFSIINRV